MYLSNLKLWCFRKFGSDTAFDIANPNFSLQFTNGLNVIIGENDSGKTAIIDAIKLVLKTHSWEFIKVDNSDFYKDSERLRIEVILKGFLPEEAKHFTEWLAWEGEGTHAQPYLKLIYDVSRKGKLIIPTDVKAGAENEGYLLTAEAREYLKCTFLRPLRDAENELVAKKNSRLSQILLGDTAFKEKGDDHELVKIFNELNDEVIKYFKGESIEIKDEGGRRNTVRPQEGKAIKDKIDGYIQEFYSRSNESNFDVVTSGIKNILEKITLSLKGDSNPGLGTLNRLFMAAELLHLNKLNWTGLRLGLIEELEAHLHPQAQMQVIEALQRQSKIQLILTTHSPNLASKLKLEHLIICSHGMAFPMGPAYTKLQTDDYKFLEKFLDTTKANLFFAKGVILVEGWAEEILIPSLAKSIGIDLTEKGVSIVNVGNLAYQRYSSIFLRRQEPAMSTPVSVVTDSDVREYYKDKDDEGNSIYVKKATREYSEELEAKIRGLNSKSEANVRLFIAPSWTLEYSLFKSTSLSEQFVEIVKSTHADGDWENDFERELASKLIKRTLYKTEIAYALSNLIEEDILAFKNGHIARRAINIDPNDTNDSINYLVKAIKYASSN